MTGPRMGSWDEEEIPQELNPPVFTKLWAKQFLWTFLKAAFIPVLWWMKKKNTYHCSIFWITIDLSQPYWEITFSGNSKHLMFRSSSFKTQEPNGNLTTALFMINIHFMLFSKTPYSILLWALHCYSPRNSKLHNTFLAQKNSREGLSVPVFLLGLTLINKKNSYN